ncbi:LacI family transcriptional regulator [Xanthomonas albilineans]|uniref:LacI family transcriptional regulator n=5 Tax=Xanthomonas albilineans TaxID=29447 RepID=UPI0005F33635|nr:LacI family transcriptional regulator [Xanthomonas albilineans]
MSKRHRGRVTGDPVTYQIPMPAGGVQMETFLPWTLVRRGLKQQVVTPLDAPQEFGEQARRERQVRKVPQDTALMSVLGLAHHWQRLLDQGRFDSMTEIAQAEGIDLGQASRMSRLAHLAPDVVEAIVSRNLAVGVSQLLRGKLSASWLAQRKALAVDQSGHRTAGAVGKVLQDDSQIPDIQGLAVTRDYACRTRVP